MELESRPLQTTVDLSVNRVQPHEKAASHTHSGRDSENTSQASGGGGGGAEAIARGGGGEEVTGTQQLELQTQHPKVQPLEDGPGPAGQQVEDGSERSTEVDGTETSERVAKLDSPLVGVGQSEEEGTRVCVCVCVCVVCVCLCCVCVCVCVCV